MSSFFRVLPAADADRAGRRALDPWSVALGVLAAVLVLGGGITVAVGLGTMQHFQDLVLGHDEDFDSAVATAIVGGVGIVLGVLVGTCWLVLGVIDRGR